MPELCFQVRKLFLLLIKLYIPILILIVIVAFFSSKTGIPVENFTKDPAAIAGINPFFGIISNIGILLWCASVSICFFSFAVLQKNRIKKKSKEVFLPFLLFSGIITLIILFDDLFLFHEGIFPELSKEFFFNSEYISERIIYFISEKFIYFSYIVLFSFYILRFKKIILKTQWIILLLAFIFFGISVTLDSIPTQIIKINYLLEDGFKLFGIVSWFGYFFRVCLQVLSTGQELGADSPVVKKN